MLQLPVMAQQPDMGLDKLQNQAKRSWPARRQSAVPLDHYPSIPATHSSVCNSFTCLYIHTSMHQFLCSSISCVHLRRHVSHPYLSVHFQVHPSIATHTSFHMPLLYKFIYPSHHIVPFGPHAGAGVQSFLSLPLSEMIGLCFCCSFNKRTLQTSVGSSAFPITHLSSTLSVSHFLLQRSFASQTKQESSDSICLSATKLSWTSSQDLSFRSFILLLFSCSLRKACNYRLCYKTWVCTSICLSLITHSSHTHCVVDPCRDS